MSAYVIVEVDVTNPEGYEEYRPLAGKSVARHGGRFVVRGGKNEVWEGEWSGRIVVLEFDDLDTAGPGTTPTTIRPPPPSGSATARPA